MVKRVALIIQKWWRGYKIRKMYGKGTKLYEELVKRRTINKKYKESK